MEPTYASNHRPRDQKLVLVMVGLPARGKTYMARKVARYLTWRGYAARVFNVGNYRREHLGAQQGHDFFDPENTDGMAARRRMAELALTDLVEWMGNSGEVAIYDATNTTEERRTWVRERCDSAGLAVIFIESVCTDPEIVEANIRETKLSMPDYADMDADQSVADFRARIAHYEDAAEDLLDSDSYIRVVNVGEQVVANRISGFLAGRLVSFLMHLHVAPRPIWITRHGESAYNVENRVGGDPPLTARGSLYAQRLAQWIGERADGPYEIWTSTLKRALETSAAIGEPTTSWRTLDEIDAGTCDGLTYAEIRERMPAEYAARSADKLRYRYPRGESYEDVIARLDPVIIELERQRSPVLVIAHQAVLRALYAYFVDEPPEQVPFLKIPLHTVIELTPRTYGCDVKRIPLLPLE